MINADKQKEEIETLATYVLINWYLRCGSI